MFVSILMGSQSDAPIMQKCANELKRLHVPFEMIVTSAHRTPQRTKEYVAKAEKRGSKVFICAAGMAAHLAGAVSSMTIKPVIGVPLCGGALDGLDALLSTVQMPSGMPVATMAIGSAGAKNAALLATQLLAISNETLENRLLEDRIVQEKKVQEESQAIEVHLPEEGLN